MDDPFVMRGLARAGNLPRDRQSIREWQRARDTGGSLKLLGQRDAVDEFEHQRTHTGTFLETVNGGDVRMVERGEDSRFALETRQPLGGTGQRLGQNLDRHIAAQSRIAGAVDFAHPAHANHRTELIGAQRAAFPAAAWWHHARRRARQAAG